MRPLLDRNILNAYLGPLKKVQKPNDISLEEFLKNSEDFLADFPKDTARVKTLLKKNWKKETLEQKVNSAYPVVHERVLNLAAEFIHYKKQNGSNIERKLYAEMDLASFFDRLLKKRPYVFYCANDKYMLRNEKTGIGGFENIGTQSEDPSLCLEEYLSYDEIKISALVSVSSLSCFINDGNRHNKGVEGKDGEFEKEGVIIGAVGARLKKKSVMEWQDCVITREQNCESLGYGNMRASNLPGIWARMWGSSFPLWDKVDRKQTDYLNFGGKKYFNTCVYRRRIQLTAEVILREAAWRAQSQGHKAYIHVVGLGLGVWRAIDEQEEIFVDAWGMALGQVDTTHISDIDFSWIKVEECKGVKDGEKLNGVNLHFSNRSLHDPVPEGRLLVCTYAWDGNSLPGNEYWLNKLCSTGDGAAACSSQVAEIHNTYINPKVCGSNLHISSRYGVEHVANYAQRITADAVDKPQSLFGETSEAPSLTNEEEWPKIGEPEFSGTKKDKDLSLQKAVELKEKDEIDSAQQQLSKEEQVGASHPQRDKKKLQWRGPRGESYHRRGSDSPQNRRNTGEVLVKNGDKPKHQKPQEDKRDRQGSHVNSGDKYKQQGSITDLGSLGSWVDNRVNGFTDREHSGGQGQEKSRRGNRIFEGDQGFSRNHSRSTSSTNRRSGSKDGFNSRNLSRKARNIEYKDDYNQSNWAAQQGTHKKNNAKEKLQRPSSERQDEQTGQRRKGTSGWGLDGEEDNFINCSKDLATKQNAHSSQLSNRQDRHSARRDRHSTQRQDRQFAFGQDRHSSRQDRHSSRQDEHSSSQQNGYSQRQSSQSKHRQIENSTQKRDAGSAERHTQLTHGQEAQYAGRESTQKQSVEGWNAQVGHRQHIHSRTLHKSSQNSQTEARTSVGGSDIMEEHSNSWNDDSHTKNTEAHRTQHTQGQGTQHPPLHKRSQNSQSERKTPGWGSDGLEENPRYWYDDSHTKDTEAHRTQHHQGQGAQHSQLHKKSQNSQSERKTSGWGSDGLGENPSYLCDDSQTKDAKTSRTQHHQVHDTHPSQGEKARPSQAQDIQPVVHDAQGHQTPVTHTSPVLNKQPAHVQEVKPSNKDMQASQADCAGHLQTHDTLIAGTQASQPLETQDTHSSCIQTSESLAPTGPHIQSLSNLPGQAFELTGSSAIDGGDVISPVKEMGPVKTVPLQSPKKAEEESYLWCEVGAEPVGEVVEISEERTEHQGKSQSYKGHSSRNPRDSEYARDVYQPNFYYHSASPPASGPYSPHSKGYRENGAQWLGRGKRGRGPRTGRVDNYHSQTPMESGKPRHGSSGRGRDYSQPPHQHPSNYPFPRTKERKPAWPMEDWKGCPDSWSSSHRPSHNEQYGQYRGKSYRGYRSNDNNYNYSRIFTPSNSGGSGKYKNHQHYMNGFDDKGNNNNCGSPERGSLNFESSRRDPNYSDDVRMDPYSHRRLPQFNSIDNRKKPTPVECNLAQREKVPSNLVDTKKEDCSSGLSGNAITTVSKGELNDSPTDKENTTDRWKDSVRSKEVISATDTRNTDPVQVEQNVILIAPSNAEESCVSSIDQSIGGEKEQAALSGQSVVEEHVSREESGQETKEYIEDGGLPREPQFVDRKTEQQPCRERVASVDGNRFWCPEIEHQKESWHQENLFEKLQPVPSQNVEVRQLTQSPAVAFQDPQPLLQHSQLPQGIQQLSQTIPQLTQVIPPFSQAMAQQSSQPVPPMSQSIPHAVSQLSPAVAPLSQALPYSQTVSPFTQPVMPQFSLLPQYHTIPPQFSPSLQPLHAQAMPHHLQARPPMNASRQSFSQQHTQASQQASQPRLLHHQGQPVQKHVTMAWLMQQQQQQHQPPPLNYEQHDAFPPPSEHTSYPSSPSCIPIDDSQFGGKHPRVDVPRQSMMSYTQESPLSNSQSQSSHFSESYWPANFHSNPLVLPPTLSPGINPTPQIQDISPMTNLVSGMPSL